MDGLQAAAEQGDATLVRGHVKWFDKTKGFGFVVADAGGPDILLHANVLRNFGQNSIADSAEVELMVLKTQRGMQAVEVISIAGVEPGEAGDTDEHDPVYYGNIPLEPARVKWFDQVKGFGFANVFGKSDDIFIHVETLRRCGFAELIPGEAVTVRISDGERGLMAVEVCNWDAALKS
jgi:CspA family cold shock protein